MWRTRTHLPQPKNTDVAWFDRVLGSENVVLDRPVLDTMNQDATRRFSEPRFRLLCFPARLTLCGARRGPLGDGCEAGHDGGGCAHAGVLQRPQSGAGAAGRQLELDGRRRACTLQCLCKLCVPVLPHR